MIANYVNHRAKDAPMPVKTPADIQTKTIFSYLSRVLFGISIKITAEPRVWRKV